MYSINDLKNEIKLIKNEELQSIIIAYFEHVVPDYFWSIPASSSGKYHPKMDLGEGGLVRHTKACVQVGLDLIGATNHVDEEDNFVNDVVIASLLIHDTFKNGLDNCSHTHFLHPIFASEQFSKFANQESEIQSKLEIKMICACVESHMGKWNSHKDYSDVLPLPTTELQNIVHHADYIASRKYIDMNQIGLFD